MTSMLFAMVASFLAATGARDQLLVASLCRVSGPSVGLLAVALASAFASAFVAAWFGGVQGRSMSQDATTMFVAMALLLAAVECAWPIRVRELRHPTRSLGAIAIVLFARQLTDASRFLIAAFAAALASPLLAGLGGAIGGSAAVAVGWTLGARLDAMPLGIMRKGLAVVLLLLALVIGMSARGLV